MEIVISYNVNAKGYGFISSDILKNNALPVLSKAIYAYLCVYRNSKTNIAYPSLARICTDLRICKNTVKKYIKILEKHNILKRNLKPYTGYTYTIAAINKSGYGTIPKQIMTDRFLHPVSKAIYALLCVYAGNEKVAYPHTNYICKLLGIGKSSYNKYTNQLISAGYMSRMQIHEGGRFSRNIFNLHTELSYTPLSLDNRSYIKTPRKPTREKILSIVRKQQILLDTRHNEDIQAIVQAVCSSLGYIYAPIYKFTDSLRSICKTKKIKNLFAYTTAMVKRYMADNNIPILQYNCDNVKNIVTKPTPEEAAREELWILSQAEIINQRRKAMAIDNTTVEDGEDDSEIQFGKNIL